MVCFQSPADGHNRNSTSLNRRRLTEKLAEISDDAPAEVAKIVSSTEGSDIYASVVSSQFDADRLRNLASRLLRRELYKCFDAGSRELPDSMKFMKFKKALREQAEALDLVWGLSSTSRTT